MDRLDKYMLPRRQLERDRGHHERAETIAVQLAGATCPDTGGIVPPVHMAATFIRGGEKPSESTLVYGRSDNPGYWTPEDTLRRLEVGADALVFSSGMAAASALVFSLRPGDCILVPTNFYAGIWEWLTQVVEGWQIRLRFVDMTDAGKLCAALRDLPGDCTALVWLESPTTPALEIVDIAALAAVAHHYGAKVVVDNTAATPVLTRPIELGADLVLHSATKALNGHDDIIAGALVTRRSDELWERIVKLRNKNGSILGSFEAWLLGRGMRTLFLRVRHACGSAMFIARTLSECRHPALADVIYPGLPKHPQHEMAARQMSGQYGNMISLRFVGGEMAALKLMGAVKIWRSGTSFGGVQSLLEHRASVEANYAPTPRDLVRLSVGSENVEDLLDDLRRALRSVTPETASEVSR